MFVFTHIVVGVCVPHIVVGTCIPHILVGVAHVSGILVMYRFYGAPCY